MYTQPKFNKTSLKVNESYQGSPIERKLERMMNNNEPLDQGAQIQYTERKDGVLPNTDIRTDRFEHAIDARDAIAKSDLARREQGIGERSYDTMTPEQQEAFNKKFPGNKFNKNSGNPSQ